MKFLILIVLTVLIQGCVKHHLGADFGTSQQINQAAQVRHPDAQETGATAEGMDGIKAGIALDQYKNADNQDSDERLLENLTD